LIVYGIFKHLYGPLVLKEPWEIWLPFHMCQIANFLIAYALLSGKRGLLIDVIYFWTFGGASMAMLTPDIAWGWPDPNYIMFMVTHGLLLGGALFFTIVEGYRPYRSSIWRAFRLSVLVMVAMIPLNHLVGGQANYFYLRYPPVAGSVMDFLPEPLGHIPFIVLLGYLVFWLVYMPYLIKDSMFGREVVETP